MPRAHAALVVLAAALAALSVTPALASGPDAESALRQVAGILDYIGADYAGAADAEGRILHQGEFDEQVALLRDAEDLAVQAGLPPDDPVVTGLRALSQRLLAVPPPDEVLAACRSLRAALVTGHGLVLEPSSVPDRARARMLYVTQKCDTCHGATGDADTPKAREMDPPPASFLDPERVAGVSPYRAFHALTFGVAGTGMASFDQLSAADRWSLAFHVLALRHDAADAARGERALDRAGWPVTPTPTRLSQLTEDDLVRALEPGIADAADRQAALAYLRAVAPFRESGSGTFAIARARLREGADAHRQGRPEEARRLFVSAYLDGIEPHEAALRVEDSRLVAEIERRMAGLRRLAAEGGSAEEVDEAATAVLALLDRAEEGRLGPATVFLGSLAIAGREGFEAALLLAGLLAVVRRRNPAHAKWVHAGWIAAVAVGVLTWLVVGQALAGLHREVAEGVVAITAAVVLLFVTHWTVGQATSRQWLGFVASRLGARASGAGRAAAWGVFLLAFIAVYREAFEVVLFYKALLADASAHALMSVLGAACGLAILVAVVLVLRRLGQRLDTKRFMIATSVVMALLALVMLGEGVRALQEAGVVPMSPLLPGGLPDFGVSTTLEGLLAQGVLLALLLASAAWAWRAGRHAEGGAAAAR